jgi:hypothetical protein
VANTTFRLFLDTTVVESLRSPRNLSRGYSRCIDQKENSPRISLRLISHNL